MHLQRHLNSLINIEAVIFIFIFMFILKKRCNVETVKVLRILTVLHI